TRLADIFGYAPDEILGQPFTILLMPEELPRLTELFYRVVQQGQTLPREETQIVRKDGSLTPIAFGWAPLHVDEAIVGLVKTAEDVTERRQLENQLLQAQKLESVGRLAGGIAHDFNNLLTAIFGYTELAEFDVALDSPALGHLRNVRWAAERAAALTGQLLA